MTEPTQEEIDEFLHELTENAERDIRPKMRASKFCITVLVPDGNDTYLALQLGMALLLDKPLLLVGIDNAWIPPRLRLLADVVVEVESMKTEAAKERVAEGIKELARKRGFKLPV